jgi:hypothetical protein
LEGIENVNQSLETYGKGFKITAGADDDQLKAFAEFLSLSRSGSALVSNEVKHDTGDRALLVHVRKVDGELAASGVLMGEGLARRDIVKMMRDAGVKVVTLNGVSAGLTTRLH